MAGFGDIAVHVPASQPVAGRQDRQAAIATAEGFNQLFEITAARWLAELGAAEPGAGLAAEAHTEEEAGGVSMSFLETLLVPLAQLPLPPLPHPAGATGGGEDREPAAPDVQAVGGAGVAAGGAAAHSLASARTEPDQVSMTPASSTRSSGHGVGPDGTEARLAAAGELTSESLTRDSLSLVRVPGSDSTGAATGPPSPIEGFAPAGPSPWAGRFPTDAGMPAASSRAPAEVVAAESAIRRAGASDSPSEAGRAGYPSIDDPGTETALAPFALALENEAALSAASVTPRSETRNGPQRPLSGVKTGGTGSGQSRVPSSAPPETREPSVPAGSTLTENSAFVARLDAAGGVIDAAPAPDASSSQGEPSRVVGQVLNHASRLVWPARSRIIVQLEPQNLGKVELRLSMRDGVLTLDIQTQLPQTRETVEAALPQLRSSLEDRGIEVGRLFASSDASGAGLSSGGQSAFGSSADRSGGWLSTHNARAVSGTEDQPIGQPGLARSADRLVDYLV